MECDKLCARCNYYIMWNFPPIQSSSDPLKVWSGCLSKCSEILESCASVFDEVKDQSVLEEIALSEEGRNKLKGKHTL